MALLCGATIDHLPHEFKLLWHNASALDAPAADVRAAMRDELDTDFCNYLNFAIEQEENKLRRTGAQPFVPPAAIYGAPPPAALLEEERRRVRAATSVPRPDVAVSDSNNTQRGDHLRMIVTNDPGPSLIRRGRSAQH